MDTTIKAALDAHRRGYVPIPIHGESKRPGIAGWQKLRYESETDVREKFSEWGKQGQTNIGVLLGEASGGLVDVDIDHPKASRLKDYFLPPTPARSGRAGRRGSHYWYICTTDLPGSTRQHLMPRGEDGSKGPVSVELRSTGAQTLIAPSVHPSGEGYLWEGKPWGGRQGPAKVHGGALAARVAMLGLASVLIDQWPRKGSRHEAYLALAGGLLRYGDDVHPFWGDKANAAEQLIRALADATHDEEGADQRVRESVDSTMRLIREGKPIRGFPSLAEIIGEAQVAQARILVAEVEQAANFTSRQASHVEVTLNDRGIPEVTGGYRSVDDTEPGSAEEDGNAPIKDRDPLNERISSWQPVDIAPYLSGQVKPVEPSILIREDGQALMYPGRVNMLYGSSESAKSWIALYTCLQVMETGQRVVYLDFEDEPVSTLSRMMMMGASPDDLLKLFTYIRPEDPISDMQRDRWGKTSETSIGQTNRDLFHRGMKAIDPTLIVADGMSVIYGLHGLNTNDTSETDIITSWLKSLTRNGRSTVIVIDHTTKGGGGKDSSPIGSQHKEAMVQGALIQAHAVQQPLPGRVGVIELLLTKDRPGQVRAASASSGGGKVQTSAIVRMDSTEEGRVKITINTPPGLGQDAVDQPLTADLSQSRDAERADRRVRREIMDRQEEAEVLRCYEATVGRILSLAEIREKLVPHILSQLAMRGAVKRLLTQGYLQKITKDGPVPAAHRGKVDYVLLALPEDD